MEAWSFGVSSKGNPLPNVMWVEVSVGSVYRALAGVPPSAQSIGAYQMAQRSCAYGYLIQAEALSTLFSTREYESAICRLFVGVSTTWASQPVERSEPTGTDWPPVGPGGDWPL